MGTTTIKVSVELRDRINRDAEAHGVTAAGLIEKLLDGYERRQRMEAFGNALRAADADYWDEFRDWDTTLSPGDDAA
ncbi:MULTISPECIES: toxin-antitoxin system protein [unclassified Gordonia (in: high G+C Gram-positive bacteria)]|uniref:toxin-antitoxin system protein n=1 Tax=unclassified Gordonia (in: high G+C Gram-positive bacteria) TaxID=2657482 RepID=UPI001F0D3F99|nr:toxin-antitoxin system protein [Gordonia sp. ABSL49_1]MCH5642560.1 toxin-antitoxin system protein [Gordonia sp. ABSL49_1]